jgi:hypothetical protein
VKNSHICPRIWACEVMSDPSKGRQIGCNPRYFA